jgi:DNA-binding response OmpR family regulator
VETATSAEQATRRIQEAPPDLLMMSASMPAGHGLRFCEMLATDRHPTPIPAVILVNQADEATLSRFRSLGADWVVKKPGMEERLGPVVRRLLDDDPAEPMTRLRPEPCVLIIDDDTDLTRVIRMQMETLGVEVLRALTGMHGYWTALRERPNVIVLNLHKPDEWPATLLRKLQAHSLTRDIPVLVFNPMEAPALESEMADVAAGTYLRQPLDFRTLKKELEKHLPLRPVEHAKL